MDTVSGHELIRAAVFEQATVCVKSQQFDQEILMITITGYAGTRASGISTRYKRKQAIG